MYSTPLLVCVRGQSTRYQHCKRPRENGRNHLVSSRGENLGITSRSLRFDLRSQPPPNVIWVFVGSTRQACADLRFVPAFGLKPSACNVVALGGRPRPARQCQQKPCDLVKQDESVSKCVALFRCAAFATESAPRRARVACGRSLAMGPEVARVGHRHRSPNRRSGSRYALSNFTDNRLPPTRTFMTRPASVGRCESGP